MKRIVVLDKIWQHVGLELDRESGNVEIVTACTNEEILNSHRKEKADLIITELHGPGMKAVQLCSAIREDRDLRNVSMIICCGQDEIELAESRQCRANAVMPLPVDPRLLHRAIQDLTNIPIRVNYRVPIVAFCTRPSVRSPFESAVENISATGMLIEAKAALKLGDMITYALDLSSTIQLQMQAEVIRMVKASSERILYGLRFLQVDPPDRHMIETIVRLTHD